MDTSTSHRSLPASPPGPHISGDDVNRIRAALNLLREELAGALGVHRATVIRWERCGKEPIHVEGLPALVLRALRDRVIVEGVRLEDARSSGRYVAQCLLRHGRLEAAAELIRFAGARTLRRAVERTDE